MTILTKENYVDKAEAVFEKSNLTKILTTTQIRNLLNLSSRLFDESKTKSYDELVDQINYLRVQLVYQSGRQDAVKKFVQKAELVKAVEAIHDIESLQLFNRYMEALVAYHRYYGGVDA